MGHELAFDRKVTLGIILTAVLSATGLTSRLVTAILLDVIFLAAFVFEANPMRSAKKTLVLTSRAKRILGVALACSVLVGLGLMFPRTPVILWVVAVQVIPLTLVVATWLLQPMERRIQLGFWKEAHAKLLQLKPKIIGITGSYGKTSVKHILGHILETQAATLITPGSINTPMGISRIVREKLTDRHRFFLCEMGAYGPGSIDRLCDLAPPDLGVIVSIGFAHHERFGSSRRCRQHQVRAGSKNCGSKRPGGSAGSYPAVCCSNQLCTESRRKLHPGRQRPGCQSTRNFHQHGAGGHPR